MLTRQFRFSASLAAVGGLVLLSACSGPSDEGRSDDGGSPTELLVWTQTQTAGTSQDAWDKIISEFERANPDITIKVEQRSTDAHKEAIRQIVGTDSGPDIYWYWSGLGLGGELVDIGLSQDVSKYYEEYDWADRFTQPALAGVTQYGGYHGVPWAQQAMAVFYNKDLFAQAEIDGVPESYDELIEANDKLVAAGIAPIQFGGTVNWHVMRLLDSLFETKCGAETHTALSLGEKSWADETCVGEAYGELKKWGDTYFNEGFLGMNNDDSSQLFFTGDAAMAFEGTWFDIAVVDNGLDPDKVGVFAFPTETERLYAFGEALYINAASENQDAAAKFLDFTTSDDMQNETSGAWAALSVNKNVDVSGDNPLDQLWPPVFADAEGVYGPSDQNVSLDVTTEYWRIQNSVLTGSISPEDAGAALQEFIDNQ